MNQHIFVGETDDAFGYLIARTRPGTSHNVVLRNQERILLNGAHPGIVTYIEDQLAKLRVDIDEVCCDAEAVTVEVGNSLTSLFAAYYAVHFHRNVTVRLLCAPSFGGESTYAKTHPLLIQKLVYNVLLKARRVVVSSPDAQQTIFDIYPRIEPGAPVYDAEAERLPDAFMPIYTFKRSGVAIFSTFERKGGIDDALMALVRIVRLYPQLAYMPVTILGSGDRTQADEIVAAWPKWNVVFNPPTSAYVEAACKAKIVLMPDQPPHAGPTRELFAAIGAGCAVVAHEHSAAGPYAGAGAVLFSDEGQRPLAVSNALLRAISDDEGLMAQTTLRRENLRSENPAFAADLGLGSLQMEDNDGPSRRNG